jgi:hypothetical protein
VIQRLRRLALQRPIVEPGSALATAVHAPAEGALDSVANAVSAYTLDVVGGAFRADVLHCETFHLEDLVHRVAAMKGPRWWPALVISPRRE